MATIAAALAARILSTRYEDVPAEGIAWAKRGILDTIGVMLAGSVHEAPAMVRELILESTSAGPCLLIGTSRRVSALGAAQANGTAAHVLDYDDSNSQIMGHPSAAILPALIAAAELVAASGRNVIAAYIAGVETVGRLGTIVNPHQYAHGWHPTATVGVFGATAACSHVLGLDEEQTAHALGMATHMAAGIKSNFGSMTKSLGVGQVARNALFAVQLARKGYTAGDRAFEHHHGYLNVFNGEGHYGAASALDRWGEPWCILDMGLKQKHSPCCFACMPAIDCMLELKERHGLRPENVERIECEVHPIRYPHIAVPDPRTGLQAKFSVYYCLARALTDGMLRIEHFEGDRWDDPRLRALMERVSFSTYAGDNYSGARVRVTTRGGDVHETYTEKALGAGYDRPLPAEMLARKFEDCAGRLLSARGVQALRTLLEQLDTAPSIRQVTDAMRPRGRSGTAKSRTSRGGVTHA